MFPLLLWGAIGVAIRVLFVAVFNPSQTKAALKLAVLSLVVVAVASYFAGQANLQGWLIKIAFAAGGFLMQYFVVQLNRIKIS